MELASELSIISSNRKIGDELFFGDFLFSDSTSFLNFFVLLNAGSFLQRFLIKMFNVFLDRACMKEIYLLSSDLPTFLGLK